MLKSQNVWNSSRKYNNGNTHDSVDTFWNQI